MNDVKYNWDRNMPAEVRAILEPMLERYRVVWPRWLVRMAICFRDSHPENAYASIRMSYQNRDGTLWIYPGFLTTPHGQEYREEIILHEIGHMLLNPYFRQVEDVVENVIKGPGGPDAQPYSIVNEVLTGALEETVSDLAYMLRIVLDGRQPARDHGSHAQE